MTRWGTLPIASSVVKVDPVTPAIPTTHGITPNAYAKELGPVELTTDCLFEQVS